MTQQPIYVLYGGTSADGRGDPEYQTFTDDWRVAQAFYWAEIHNNPYTTGHVVIMTKSSYRHATEEDFK